MIDHTVITPNRLGSLPEAWSKNLKTKWGSQDMIDLICQGHKTYPPKSVDNYIHSILKPVLVTPSLTYSFTPPFRDSTEKTHQKSHAQAATDSYMAEVPIGPWVPTCHHLWAEWTPLVWNQWWRSLFVFGADLIFNFFTNQNHPKSHEMHVFWEVSTHHETEDRLQRRRHRHRFLTKSNYGLGLELPHVTWTGSSFCWGMFRWKPARPKGNLLIRSYQYHIYIYTVHILLNFIRYHHM